MIPYIVIIVVAGVYGGLRAKHDSYIREGKWKRWAMLEAGFITLVVSLLFTYIINMWLVVIPLFMLFGLTFWLVFDMAVGKLFGGSIWYLGRGAWDERMKSIFLNGKYLAMCKVIGIMGFSGLYFAIIIL